MKSQMLFDRSKKVVPGGVHSPVRSFKGVNGSPLFFEHAKGALLKSVDGEEYLDFCMSFGPLLFGHQDANVQAVAALALSRGWSYGTAEPYSLQLSEFICDRIACVEKIRFVSSGTEAVMSALRIARAATQRDLILKFDGCYHGHVDSMLVKAGSGLAQVGLSDSAGVSAHTAKQTLVCPLGDLTAVQEIFAAFPDQIAAVILEPLPANYGLLIQEKAFVEAVMKIAHDHQSLVIFDEVISGFRVAFGGMAEIWNLKPDLVTYGKIMGGGFPVGAVGGKKAYMDLLSPLGPVYQAGTLSANPVCMQVGLCMLGMCDVLRPYDVLALSVKNIADQLNAYAQQIGCPVHVVHFGSLFWFFFGGEKTCTRVDQIPPNHAVFFRIFFDVLLEEHIYFPPSAFEVGFLSTAHTADQINQLISAAKKGFLQVSRCLS
jgi:glutamate-1-semialdehyde 2,1-aminomutase